MAATIVSTIRNLSRRSDTQYFASKCGALTTQPHDEGEQEMVDYFEQNWSRRVEQLDGFARKSSCIHTNMLIERWNKKALAHQN